MLPKRDDLEKMRGSNNLLFGDKPMSKAHARAVEQEQARKRLAQYLKDSVLKKQQQASALQKQYPFLKVSYEIDPIEGNRLCFKQDGKFHRMDGPAVINDDGEAKWFQNGLLHRDDGPAVKSHNTEIWYQNGKRHREDGAAFSSWYSDQTGDYVYQIWYSNGIFHRDDGPAVVEKCDDQIIDQKHYLHGERVDK